MNIETKHTIKDFGNGDAQLTIHVLINGQEVGSIVPFSGPRADLDDFIEGRATAEEIIERWTHRAKKRRVG